MLVIMMLKPDSAHTGRWRIGEVVSGIPFVISLALHGIWPFSFGGLGANNLRLAGVCVAACDTRIVPETTDFSALRFHVDRRDDATSTIARALEKKGGRQVKR